MSDLVVAITGASGAVYGLRLIQVLLEADRRVHLTISQAGALVLAHERGLEIDLDRFDPELLLGSGVDTAGLVYHHHADFSAGIASGSFPTGGMAICPCSMGTLAALATGLSRNLIQRAADVHLKERRRLVVVPRETPLGTIQLENMRVLAAAGAVVLPAAPGFYHHPAGIDDLVDFVVARVCDQLGVACELVSRWGSDETG